MRKSLLKKITPTFFLRSFNRIGLYKSFVPPLGKVDFGDLDRTAPFSNSYGFKRGGPVDRFYIEDFLQRNASKIKGRVLEIGDNKYTLKYGGSNVAISDILHIDESNKKANFIGDLSNAPHLPDSSFDCVILTQTLHLIYDFKNAIATCHRVLKPGGTLLLTVPGISHIGPDEWSWLWSFTAESLKRVLLESFKPERTVVENHGNVLVATAFLYGLGRADVNTTKLKQVDPHYQVIIAASAEKE